MAARCQFANSYDMATGSQMPIRFEAVMENNSWIGNRHKAASCKFISPGVLAPGTGSQRPIRFEAIIENNR